MSGSLQTLNSLEDGFTSLRNDFFAPHIGVRVKGREDFGFDAFLEYFANGLIAPCGRLVAKEQSFRIVVLNFFVSCVLWQGFAEVLEVAEEVDVFLSDLALRGPSRTTSMASSSPLRPFSK